MGVTVNSKAAIIASAIRNQSFTTTPRVVPRKIVIIGNYDPGKTDIVPDQLIQVTSPEQVGSICGFGFVIHRLAVQAFKGSRGEIETWIIPQEEDDLGIQATGDLDFTGSTGEGGNISLYIGGILDFPVIIPVVDGATAAEICSDTVDAINAIKELPVTAAINVTPEICDIIAKQKGAFGNSITIAFNLKGESPPPGIVVSVSYSPALQYAGLTGGAGTCDIQPALDAMGTGDNANEKFFTDPIHGYPCNLVNDDILNYVGAGNEKVGLYSELVHRPFQTIVGSRLIQESGLATLIALGNGRKLDRANGVLGAPGSYSIAEEISAQAMGIRARIANIRPEENYVDRLLQDIDPGEPEDRWTDIYNNRDLAVKNGISPTVVRNGNVYLQNLITFYHPDEVPVNSNGYASFRNLALIQNLLDSQYRTFTTEKWKNFTIVEDVTKITSTVSREKVRDIDAVRDECVKLIKAWYGLGWIYETSYAIQRLSDPDAIVIRGGTDGFDINLKVILSGEGLIVNITTAFDTSIAVLSE